MDSNAIYCTFDEFDGKGRSMLWHAIMRADRGATERLLALGADPACIYPNPNGGPCFHGNPTLEYKRAVIGGWLLQDFVLSVFAFPEETDARLAFLTFLLDDVKIPCTSKEPMHLALGFGGDVSQRVRRILVEHGAGLAEHPNAASANAFRMRAENLRTELSA